MWQITLFWCLSIPNSNTLFPGLKFLMKWKPTYIYGDLNFSDSQQVFANLFSWRKLEGSLIISWKFQGHTPQEIWITAIFPARSKVVSYDVLHHRLSAWTICKLMNAGGKRSLKSYPWLHARTTGTSTAVASARNAQARRKTSEQNIKHMSLCAGVYHKYKNKSCFSDGSCWEIIIIKQIHTFTSNILFEQRRFGLGCPSLYQVIMHP